MRAVVITREGGAEALEVRDRAAPEPRGDQVRVRVRAAGLNRADLMQARGRYPAPPGVPADVPGLEYAGEVEAIGPDCVGSLKVGDRVFGIVGGGGLAEYVVTQERLAVPIPDLPDGPMPFEQAAAVPEAFLTAQDAIEARGRARPGDFVLIHAVGGGVGSAAAQVAHSMGCPALGTARSAEKCARVVAELPIAGVINTGEEDFVEAVRDHTKGRMVDVILDHVGAPYWEKNLEALAPKGRLVVVGLLGGSKVQADLATLLRKRLTVVGTTLRARPLEEKIAVTRRFAESVAGWLGAGRVRPIVDRVYALDEIRAAQERLESNAGFGKIVVRM